MGQFRESVCKMVPKMGAGCMESRMKKSMGDLQMMIP
jgi:hypothetical protein